ncbi:MAG: multiheme c-type cytochrome [Pseudomonadota bacterium]|nr:multiheme c-type cytochrome [Pseudomonadota bacterium]
MGGLPRQKTIITAMQQEHPANQLLLINTGNLTKPSIKRDYELNRRQTSIITKVYQQMDCDVLTPGFQELIDGNMIITALVKAAGTMPLVCSNLKNVNKLGIKPYVVLHKSGRKILITSLMDPRVGKKAIHGLRIEEPAASLKKILAAVPHDLAITVLHFSDRKARKIISQVPGIDLAILATQRGIMATPEAAGKSYLVKNNNHGKTVNYLDWDFASRKPIKYSSLKVSKEDIKPEPKIAKLVNDYEIWLRNYYIRLEKAADESGTDEQQTSTYVGFQTCAQCHPEIVADWKTSRHGRAYASLQKKCKDYCPDCLPCHVTGKKNPLNGVGFLSPKKTPHLFDVQCEQCHGSAHQHVKNPKKPYGVTITQDTCIVCHTGQSDPEFSFDHKIDLVNH